MKATLFLGIAALTLAGSAQAEAVRTPSGKSTKAKAPVSTTRPTPTPEADAVPPEEELEHVVKPGETLGGIANRTQVPRVLIIEANHLKPPYSVHTGQKLALPRTRHHTVKKGETGFDIAYRYGVPFADIAVANGMAPDDKVKVGQKLLIPTVVKPSAAKPTPAKTEDAAPAIIDAPAAKAESKADRADTPAVDRPRLFWPVEGKVRRPFTPRDKTDANGDYHEGIDIPAPAGTAVRAAASGTVIFAGREPKSFGNMVVVEHDNGWSTAYGFLSKVTVKKGDAVTAHERVGLIGHSGRASRDELHFELRRANHPVDPQNYLPKAKKAGKTSAKKAENAEKPAKAHTKAKAKSTKAD